MQSSLASWKKNVPSAILGNDLSLLFYYQVYAASNIQSSIDGGGREP